MPVALSICSFKSAMDESWEMESRTSFTAPSPVHFCASVIASMHGRSGWHVASIRFFTGMELNYGIIKVFFYDFCCQRRKLESFSLVPETRSPTELTRTGSSRQVSSAVGVAAEVGQESSACNAVRWAAAKHHGARQRHQSRQRAAVARAPLKYLGY